MADEAAAQKALEEKHAAEVLQQKKSEELAAQKALEEKLRAEALQQKELEEKQEAETFLQEKLAAEKAARKALQVALEDKIKAELVLEKMAGEKNTEKTVVPQQLEEKEVDTEKMQEEIEEVAARQKALEAELALRKQQDQMLESWNNENPEKRSEDDRKQQMEEDAHMALTMHRNEKAARREDYIRQTLNAQTLEKPTLPPVLLPDRQPSRTTLELESDLKQTRRVADIMQTLQVSEIEAKFLLTSEAQTAGQPERVPKQDLAQKSNEEMADLDRRHMQAQQRLLECQKRRALLEGSNRKESWEDLQRQAAETEKENAKSVVATEMASRPEIVNINALKS